MQWIEELKLLHLLPRGFFLSAGMCARPGRLAMYPRGRKHRARVRGRSETTTTTSTQATV